MGRRGIYGGAEEYAASGGSYDLEERTVKFVEADDAVSKKEFINIIGTCRKEARECKFFIRMLVKACPELRDTAIQLWREANELHLIFSRIRRTAQTNLKAAAK